MSSSIKKLWSNPVAAPVQALLRPYLNSKFEIVDVARSQKNGITFGSHLHTRSGSTFRRWLYLWLKMLVSNASGAARWLHRLLSTIACERRSTCPDQDLCNLAYSSS